MASERELRGKKTAWNASETVPINDSNVPTRDSNAKECAINDDVSEEKDLVRCFCGNDQDFGGMACCDLCSGWFHFRCMRFKEGVDLLAKKDFVCCFCLASKTLSLLREVACGLWHYVNNGACSRPIFYLRIIAYISCKLCSIDVSRVAEGRTTSAL